MAFVPASGITKRKPEMAKSIIKFYKIYEIFIVTLKVQSWLSSKIGSEQCYFYLKCFSPLTCTHRRRLAFVTCLEMCGNGWKIMSMAFVGLNRICSMTTFLHPFLMESTTWSWYVVSNIYELSCWPLEVLSTCFVYSTKRYLWYYKFLAVSNREEKSLCLVVMEAKFLDLNTPWCCKYGRKNEKNWHVCRAVIKRRGLGISLGYFHRTIEEK